MAAFRGVAKAENPQIDQPCCLIRLSHSLFHWINVLQPPPQHTRDSCIQASFGSFGEHAAHYPWRYVIIMCCFTACMIPGLALIVQESRPEELWVTSTAQPSLFRCSPPGVNPLV